MQERLRLTDRNCCSHWSEAVAIYLDLQFRADICCNEFLLEGDSKEIIRKLQSTSEDLSTVRLIISDIKEAVRILTLNPKF
ncbi:hypothetical protein GQ457_10G013270 [Hibiscus cannabinus]